MDYQLDTLRQMWAQALSVDPKSVRAESDFFATGGSSLEVGVLINDVSERFGIEVSVADFFMAPDFQTLTELCEGSSQASDASRRPSSS